jgi:hypothetical protein
VSGRSGLLVHAAIFSRDAVTHTDRFGFSLADADADPHADADTHTVEFGITALHADAGAYADCERRTYHAAHHRPAERRAEDE